MSNNTLTNEELKFLHKQASYHRDDLIMSKELGCFYCLERFSFNAVEEFTDGGETAMCPACGVDSVLPYAEYLSDEALKEMQAYWFKE